MATHYKAARAIVVYVRVLQGYPGQPLGGLETNIALMQWTLWILSQIKLLDNTHNWPLPKRTDPPPPLSRSVCLYVHNL